MPHLTIMNMFDLRQSPEDKENRQNKNINKEMQPFVIG